MNRSKLWNNRWLRSLTFTMAAVLLLAASLGVTGCSHFHSRPSHKYVYVIAKQVRLIDRVAAVSNRTGEVTSGEKLIVLERTPRWLKVQSPRGEVGWIEEKKTADQALADKFDQLRADHAKDPVVASATARDEVYMHVAPGRETDRFYLLQEGDKLNLLKRATVQKPVPPGAALAASRPVGPATGPDGQPAGPPPPVMEDWWLARDAKGDTGWVYSHLVDVDAPDTLARYAEGQRIVGAYILAHVDDPDSGMINSGQTVTSIPEYLTVLGPYKAGLPYDFDQVRVFTWNVKKHRYETAFREHDIAGYLPVVLAMKTDPYGKSIDATTPMPSFSYRVLAASAQLPQPDPKTGLLTPSATITKTYRLEGNICRRLLAPGTQPPRGISPRPRAGQKRKSSRKRQTEKITTGHSRSQTPRETLSLPKPFAPVSTTVLLQSHNTLSLRKAEEEPAFCSAWQSCQPRSIGQEFLPVSKMQALLFQHLQLMIFRNEHDAVTFCARPT